jgi:hypothetical protein
MIKTLKADWNKLTKLPMERKIILVLLIAVLFTLSIYVGGLLNKQTTEEQAVEQQSTTPVETKNITDLSLSPDSASMIVGEGKQIDVILSQTPVSVTDISLTYDPTVVQVSNIQNGTVFDRVIRKTAAAGKITFSAAVSPEKKANLTTGTVFSFTVKGLSAGTTTIGFDIAKTITALNGVNSLGNTGEAKIEIQ